MSQVFTCNHCNLGCKSRGGLTNHQRGCPEKLSSFIRQQIEEFAQASNSQIRQEMKEGFERLSQNDVQLSENLSSGINQLGQQGEKIAQKIDQVQETVDQVQETVDHFQEQFEFIRALIQEKSKIFDMIEYALKSGENKQLDELTPDCVEMLNLVLTDTNDFRPVFKDGEYQLLLENPEDAQPLCQRIQGIKTLVKAKNVRIKHETC